MTDVLYRSVLQKKQLTRDQLRENERFFADQKKGIGVGKDPPYVAGWEIIPGFGSFVAKTLAAIDALDEIAPDTERLYRDPTGATRVERPDGSGCA